MEVIVRARRLPYLVLIGLQGTQPYAPLRVLRQVGRFQDIPTVDKIGYYTVDHNEGRISNARDIIKLWDSRQVYDEDTLAKDRYHTGCGRHYLKWLQQDVAETIPPNIADKGRCINKDAKMFVVLKKIKEETLKEEAKHREQHEKDVEEIARLRKKEKELSNEMARLRGEMEENKRVKYGEGSSS